MNQLSRRRLWELRPIRLYVLDQSIVYGSSVNSRWYVKLTLRDGQTIVRQEATIEKAVAKLKEEFRKRQRKINGASQR